ncbi:hypothetical protein ACFPLB_07800 [Aquamicrobium segne]|uniref:Uncharacterized protein n=1 Tax=Aquamicrobium segne TaxID=469547 RepID=A0ABW0GW22_9HYPH
MLDSIPEKKESRAERTDRIARELINAKRSEIDKKTARLRNIRLQMEQIDKI